MTPEAAFEIIEAEKKEYGVENPTNLEEQAINMVGKTIYEKLIKNYTEKQSITTIFFGLNNLKRGKYINQRMPQQGEKEPPYKQPS